MLKRMLANENTNLLENETPQAEETIELDACEQALHTCTNPQKPISYFFQSGIERRFRQVITEGKHTCTEFTIAYRGDSRPPEEIFEIGLSAYSLKRMFKRDTFLNLAACLCCLPIMLPLCIYTCVISYFPDQPTDRNRAFSLGSCFGQDYFNGTYVTNWSALALAKNIQNAHGYFSRDAHSDYRYMVCLPNGYIDFDAFCKEIEPITKYEYDYENNPFGPQSVREIIPNGIQKVSSACIIGALKMVPGEGKVEAIYLNPNCQYDITSCLNQVEKELEKDPHKPLLDSFKKARSQLEINQTRELQKRI